MLTRADTRVSRRRLILAAILLATVATALFLLRSQALLVRFHDWRMRTNWEQHYSQPPESVGAGLGAISVGAAYSAYEHHRDRLIDLGAVQRFDLVLTHLRRPSPEAKHFIRWLLRDAQPPCIDWRSPADPAAEEPLAFTVWCYAADSSRCKQVFLSRDVPDYASRFMQSGAQ
jgi:hypothetical protein